MHRIDVRETVYGTPQVNVTVTDLDDVARLAHHLGTHLGGDLIDGLRASAPGRDALRHLAANGGRDYLVECLHCGQDTGGPRDECPACSDAAEGVRDL